MLPLRSSSITEPSSLLRTTLPLSVSIGILHFDILLIAFPFTNPTVGSQVPIQRPFNAHAFCTPAATQTSNQVTSEFIPRHPPGLGFDNDDRLFGAFHQRFVCTHLRRTHLTDLIPPFPQRSLPRP